MALIHRPITALVVTALQDVFGGGYQADKVIERVFKHNRKLGARDRRFIAEATYEIIRHWRLLWTALGASEASLEPDDLMRVLGAWLMMKEPGVNSARVAGVPFTRLESFERKPQRKRARRPRFANRFLIGCMRTAERRSAKAGTQCSRN